MPLQIGWHEFLIAASPQNVAMPRDAKYKRPNFSCLTPRPECGAGGVGGLGEGTKNAPAFETPHFLERGPSLMV